MNAHHQDGPPAGMSRREWREQQGSAPDEPAALPEFLGDTVASEEPRSTLTILTVCTGNICRSPMAELLLRARLEPLGVRVHSAGTRALVDRAMTAQAQELAVRHGATVASAAAHTARLLVEPLLEESDLVLTMAREHRSHVVQMVPSLLRQTFTVREFARLATTVSDADVRAAADAAGSDQRARLAAALRLLGEQRGLVLAAADDDDVIDPYRRSQNTYETAAAQLVPALGEVERVVQAALR